MNCTVWKEVIFFLNWKIFREINVQCNLPSFKYVVDLRNFCEKWWEHHTVEKWEILSHLEEISWNQFSSNFLSKNVAFTKFLRKKMLTVWKNEKFSVTHKKFRQINSLVFSLVKTLLSRNFCQIIVTVNFRNFHTVWKVL